MSSAEVPPQGATGPAARDEAPHRAPSASRREPTWEQALARFTEVLDDLTVDAGAVADQRAIRDAVDAVSWLARGLPTPQRRRSAR